MRPARPLMVALALAAAAPLAAGCQSMIQGRAVASFDDQKRAACWWRGPELHGAPDAASPDPGASATTSRAP